MKWWNFCLSSKMICFELSLTERTFSQLHEPLIAERLSQWLLTCRTDIVVEELLFLFLNRSDFSWCAEKSVNNGPSHGYNGNSVEHDSQGLYGVEVHTEITEGDDNSEHGE